MRGRPNHQNIVLDRYFGNLPVVEATANLRIVAIPDDVDDATRGDPERCALAQACRRLYQSSAVVFLRRTAYVDLPDENGTRQLNRFVVSAVMRDRIIAFDQTGEFPPGGFVLYAPAPSETLEALRTKNRERRAYVKGEAFARAEVEDELATAAARGPEQPPTPKQPAVVLEGARDGRGMVHFTPTA